MIRPIIIAYLVLECAAYVLFFSHFSLLSGLAIGLGSTFVGLLTAKFAGRRLVVLAAEGIRSGSLKHVWNSETFLVLGAFFLLLPGFISDLAGLLMLAFAALRPRAKAPPQNPRDIELSDKDWRRLPDDPA